MGDLEEPVRLKRIRWTFKGSLLDMILYYLKCFRKEIARGRVRIEIYQSNAYLSTLYVTAVQPSQE